MPKLHIVPPELDGTPGVVTSDLAKLPVSGTCAGMPPELCGATGKVNVYKKEAGKCNGMPPELCGAGGSAHVNKAEVEKSAKTNQKHTVH
jgi:hypothetical protein